MLKFIQGDLLNSKAEALVNTVNTVGVMGKGIALMFKEAFPNNFKAYEIACKNGEVTTGKLFITRNNELVGPKWIINFPTKSHWRYPSRIEWIDAGLVELRHFIIKAGIKSIALPPLGAGNGRLDWNVVRSHIEQKLGDLTDTEIFVFEPTAKYQNVAKRSGVEKLTPPRALIAELVRRYSILGIECTLLEVQKLGYFLERFSALFNLGPLKFDFSANKYGPYSDRLKHMLDGLDGSYLHCNKRIGDASPLDGIVFDYTKKDLVAAYLTTQDAKKYAMALEATSKLIDGFESPLSMELLATVDWLIWQEKVEANVASIKLALMDWPGGAESGARKLRLFEDRMISIAIDALRDSPLLTSTRIRL